MKLKYIALAVLISISIVLIDYSLYAPQLLAAQSSGLTIEQRQQLESLSIETILPQYLPDGLQVIDVKLEDGRATGYTVLYGQENTCFLIEAINKGIGDTLDLESMRPIVSKLFGNGYFLNYGPPKDAEVKKEFPDPDLYSDWMKYENAYYRLSGSLLAREEYDYANCRQDISADEALKVVQSLAPIDHKNKVMKIQDN